MKSFILLFILFTGSCSFSQSNSTPCLSPAASLFDFWIGEWNLTWNDSLHGVNKIEKMLGNCTIHENFSDPNTNFKGQSWSVYNPATDLWQQTWVDNQGGYIVLTGNMENDKMILKTAEKQTPNGKQQMRMVFYNIKLNSFEWSWEATKDSGKTWISNWKIHYERRQK